jgi:hypothetical protein
MFRWLQQQRLSIAGSHLPQDDVLDPMAMELVAADHLNTSSHQSGRDVRHPPRGCGGHRVASCCDQAKHHVLSMKKGGVSRAGSI